MFPPPPNAPPPDRLPNYLLSPPPTHPTPPLHPSSKSTPPPPQTTTLWNNPSNPRRSAHVTFNDRLRQSPSNPPTPTTPAPAPQTSNQHPTTRSPFSRPYEPHSDRPSHRTPSRMPPNKSLLDSGTPSILNLRSPISPNSATRRSLTPGTPFPQLSAAGAARTPATPPMDPVAGIDRWITAFGFSPSQESQVLRELRRHGDIVRSVAGRGNWIHVMYRTALQAQVALYKPWRVLNGTETMVGVVPCTEHAVAKDAEEQVERGVLVASPSTRGGGTPVPPPRVAGGGTPAAMMRRSAAGGGAAIVRTPQKQMGVLDYISGFYK